MKIRLIGALLCSAGIALVTTTGAFAQNKNNGIGDGKPGVFGVGNRKPAATKGEPTLSNGSFESKRSAKPSVNTGPAKASINTTRSNIKRPDPCPGKPRC